MWNSSIFADSSAFICALQDKSYKVNQCVIVLDKQMIDCRCAKQIQTIDLSLFV